MALKLALSAALFDRDAAFSYVIRPLDAKGDPEIEALKARARMQGKIEGRGEETWTSRP
ncbi:MAG: hypothetical protein HC897_17210 [Thermoanaerobaculia bacterium]|nr:hypothetical protein [Thermoanaerobaculia bacterium]